MSIFIFSVSHRMQRLSDFKTTEQTSRPAIKSLPMQFDNNEATRRIALHHAKRLIH